jgi:hypothetical protein
MKPEDLSYKAIENLVLGADGEMDGAASHAGR